LTPAPPQTLPVLTVIVPCFNEEAVIASTYERLISALRQLTGIGYRILFVDDGSRDRTLELLRQFQATDSQVRVLSLSRNFGHQIAVTAGLEHAEGDAVAVIDADLQDPPEALLDMVAAWRGGADVAYAVRVERDGESWFKLVTARAFYRLINRMSDTAIPLDTGDFRLMDRRVVNGLLAMPERDRFLRGMVAWVGYRQEPIPIQRAPRAAGVTHYPLRRMVRFAVDGILSFSMTPLRMATALGFISAGLALAGIVYALVLRLLTDIWVEGWTLLFIAVLFIGGVQLIVLGIQGEYLGRIYGEVKSRPLYLLKERLGFTDPPDR
jgi:dolichol-phosphate mannosyltransferase